MATFLVHPFEAAGLGQPPFRLVSVVTGGLRGCSLCGTGIKVHCHIRSADGRTFVVGSDCVRHRLEKVDTTLALDVRRAHDNLLREQRDTKREARWQALKARMDAARVQLDADPDLFAAEPHPNEYFAKQGLRMRDYFDWQLRHGSQVGRAQVCKAIETACGVAHA